MTTLTEVQSADRSSEYAPWAGKRRSVMLPNRLTILDMVMTASGRGYPTTLTNFVMVCLGCAGAAALLLSVHGNP